MMSAASLPIAAHLVLTWLLVPTCSAIEKPAKVDARLQWPRHIPRSLKYFPEDEPIVKRGLDAHHRIATGNELPIGMRRMSGDPDEMFFLDYWLFREDMIHGSNGNSNGAAQAPIAYANGTDSWMSPPMLAHATSPNPSASFSLLHAMQKRDFTCPNGFSSCAGIGRQYSCCASGTTCVVVQDTGLGDVGCCASGASCGGSGLGSCDTSRGYKSCPGSSNGGCCLPGFDCLGVGCVSVSASTTTTTLGVSTVRACASGDQTCPSSLGGGCCAASLTCGTSNTCLGGATTTTTTAAAVAPVRPTDVASSSSSSAGSADAAVLPSITSTGTQLVAICPTNYYFCSAYYRPGCCQIGRDCKLTNCPAAASSSTFVSNGVTVVVPVGPTTGGTTYQSTALITGTAAAASFPAGGTCMDGWATCAQSLLGGCCPQGFSCGAVCTGDVGSGQTVVAKMKPNEAGASLSQTFVGRFSGFAVVILGIWSGMLMVVL